MNWLNLPHSSPSDMPLALFQRSLFRQEFGRPSSFQSVKSSGDLSPLQHMLAKVRRVCMLCDSCSDFLNRHPGRDSWLSSSIGVCFNFWLLFFVLLTGCVSDTERELATRLAIFGVSGVAGNMFLGILQAALYKNLDGAHGLEVRMLGSRLSTLRG